MRVAPAFLRACTAAFIVAPVASGERRGSVRVTLGDEVLAERPLLALQDVAEGSLWQRAKDYVRMWLE